MGNPTYPDPFPEPIGPACGIYGGSLAPRAIITFSGIRIFQSGMPAYDFFNRTFILPSISPCVWALALPVPPIYTGHISYQHDSQRWVIQIDVTYKWAVYRCLSYTTYGTHGENELISPVFGGQHQILFEPSPGYPSAKSIADSVCMNNQNKTFEEHMGFTPDQSTETNRFASHDDGTCVYIKRP